ncbi:MAG: hypothetical protein GX591_10825 [Planctomycetes bacterium]|jgi:F1F0 ATPase subunit 2|nr:hypothetical protein [Planctomycetota bacterium]
MDVRMLIMGLLAGAAAAAVFLAGLWWTARRLPHAGNVAALFIASFVVRMGAVLAVFWLLARSGEWEALAAGLVGFTLVRIAAVRQVRAGAGKDAL